MNPKSSSNSNPLLPKINPLEAIRDTSRIATDTVNKQMLKPMASEAVRQIFGLQYNKNVSGEIQPGESVEMRDVFTGRQTEKHATHQQIILERQLRSEETVFVEKRTQELRVQIAAIQEEVIKLSQVTPQLEQDIQIAAMQVSVNPSTYDLFFLQGIFEFIKSFRKRIENAHVWLSSANKRSQKKNVWGANYKKSGSKYLLSSEHYLQRSAG